MMINSPSFKYPTPQISHVPSNIHTLPHPLNTPCPSTPSSIPHTLPHPPQHPMSFHMFLNKLYLLCLRTEWQTFPVHSVERCVELQMPAASRAECDWTVMCGGECGGGCGGACGGGCGVHVEEGVGWGCGVHVEEGVGCMWRRVWGGVHVEEGVEVHVVGVDSRVIQITSLRLFCTGVPVRRRWNGTLIWANENGYVKTIRKSVWFLFTCFKMP